MPPGHHQQQHALPTDSFPIVTEAWGDVRGLSEPNNMGNGNFLPDIRDAPTSRAGMRPGLFGGFVREVQSPDHLRSEARIRSLKNELKNLQHRFEAEVQVSTITSTSTSRCGPRCARRELSWPLHELATCRTRSLPEGMHAPLCCPSERPQPPKPMLILLLPCRPGRLKTCACGRR